jgi:membrane-bound lytic murein transglycosylase B
LLYCCAFVSQAQPQAVDYSRDPQVPALLQRLREDDGFSQAELQTVTAALADARRLPQLIVQEQKAPERTENWTQYSKRIDDSRVRAGVALLQDQREPLSRAEQEFGVPPSLIAGLLGIETRYGRITGSIRVLDALATQGFEHPTRSAFFFSELIEFFALCRDAGFDPRDLKGSYAGAMGDAQFMPSNYRRLALDYDNDGTRDLWSLPDAIGSIANYFTHYQPIWRWRRGEPIAIPATLKADALPPGAVANSRDHFYTVRELGHVGFMPSVDIPGDTVVGIIELPLDDGSKEYWFAFPNFYAVMSYNPRVFYAMAVTRLAQRIEAAAGVMP